MFGKNGTEKSIEEKMLLNSRITCIAAVAMAVIILVSCIMIVPRVNSTLHQAQDLITEASGVLENANNTLAGFDEMSAEIKDAADGINGLVDDNSEVLADSMAKLNAIDFEGLNKAIADLEAVVEPMARFFSKFK